MAAVRWQMRAQTVVLQVLGIAKHDRLDDALNMLIRPDAQQYALRPPAPLWPQIGPAIDRRSQHIVHPIRIQHKRRIGYIIFARRLRQRQALLQHAEYGLGHRLGPPRLKRAALPKAHMMHQILIGVPAFLPHRLQLILIAVCWRWQTKHNGA